MKVENKGIEITEIEAEGVTCVTRSMEGMISLYTEDNSIPFRWSEDEARNLIAALQAAVGVSDTGPWPALYLIPQQVTTVWDRDGEKTYRSDLCVGGSGWNNQDGYGPYTLTKD